MNILPRRWRGFQEKSDSIELLDELSKCYWIYS